jgi:hypothetical protein
VVKVAQTDTDDAGGEEDERERSECWMSGWAVVSRFVVVTVDLRDGSQDNRL